MSLLNIKYSELLSMSILQEFYDNNYCKKYTINPETDFVLIPSLECLQTLKKLDFIVKDTKENAGITIFSRVRGVNDDGDNLLRFKPEPGDKLCFWMVLKNPALVNFNQLPISIDSSKIFYFTNQLTDAGALRNHLHITNEVSGVNETKDVVIKMGSEYTYHHTENVVENTAVVKHVITGREVKPNSIINKTNAAYLYFNLSSLPQGKCDLFISNIKVDNFYYVGQDAPKNMFGVIELLLDTNLQDNCRIVEIDRSLTNERPFYELRFINRSTLWRYTLELKPNSPLFLEMNALPANDKQDFKNKLNITTNDDAITFKQTSVSPDGSSFQFESNSALLLQEKYISSSSLTRATLSLTLKKYIGVPAKEAIVRTDLQCPSSGFIDAKNNPTIYSDILLTI